MSKKCSKCLEIAEDSDVFCSKCGSQTFVQEANDNDEQVVELNLGHIKEEEDNGVGFNTPQEEHSIKTEEQVNEQVVNQKSSLDAKPNTEPVADSKPVVQSANPVPNANFVVRNPQYDNPNGSPSPINGGSAVKHRKKRKQPKVLIGICGIVGVILLVLSLTLFLLLFLAGDDDAKYNPASTFTEKNSISIGNDVNGYIRVPNTWKKVENGAQDGSIVYTDNLENGLWYVVSGFADSGKTSPHEWANSTYTSLVSQGVMEAGIDREVVNNYETYKVVCFKPNVGRYLASWYFNTSDGRTHYIAVEGPDAINDFYNMIYTYREKN